MKKHWKEIVVIVLFVIACVVLILFDEVFSFSKTDAALDMLIKETLSRFLVFALLLPTVFLLDTKAALYKFKGGRSLLWCFPALLVAFANFPFSALFTGSAAFFRTDLLWLYTLDCLGIGLLEELLFRGILLPLLVDIFKKKSLFLPVLVSAAVFGLWHLVNLLGGASIPDTALQVGYSFLIGGLLACLYLRTGNIWTGVFIHALFDFGGLVGSHYIVTGNFQDLGFWIATAVCGVLCAGHIILYLVREEKKFRLALHSGEPSAGEGNKENITK